MAFEDTACEVRNLKRKCHTKITGSDADVGPLESDSVLNPSNVKLRGEMIKKRKNGKGGKKTDSNKRTESTSVQRVSENIIKTSESDVSKQSKTTSKRQLKRKRAEKRILEKKETGRLEAIKRGLNYISKWKHAREEWKFEKLRQVWLAENLLDADAIPNNIFPTVLEYFEGCKGRARSQLLEKSMNVIRAMEEKKLTEDDRNGENETIATNENTDDVVRSTAYERARQVLQVLPTEM